MQRDEIVKKLEDTDRYLAGKLGILQERERETERIEQEINLLTQDLDLLTKTSQVLLMISTKVLGQSTDTIDKLVTTGLRLTFDDQNLSFKTRVEKARGKTALKFDLYQDARLVPIMQSYGGGVLVTVGMLLRAVTIIVLGLKRVLILDETLAHLATQYVPNLGKLLRKMSKELGFTILLITHEQEFSHEADLHYTMERKEGETRIKIATRT